MGEAGNQFTLQMGEINCGMVGQVEREMKCWGSVELGTRGLRRGRAGGFVEMGVDGR